MIIILMKPLFLQIYPIPWHGCVRRGGSRIFERGGGHQILRSTSKKKVGWGRMGWGGQGSHGHGKSWKILKFETILESHGKVMDFCLFSRSHGKLIFQEKVIEFYTNR